MEEKARAEDEYYCKLREDGTKAQKNTSNVAYDILTLQYNQDDIGAQQKYMDDMGTLFTLNIYFILLKLSYVFTFFQ